MIETIHPRECDPMTDQPPRPTTPRVAFYGRTNQTGPDADRHLARQDRPCLPVAARLGPLAACYYDIGLDTSYAQGRAQAIQDAGGPPRRDGGSHELTAELARTDGGIDVIVLANHDRLPRQPPHRRPLVAAADRRRCPILTAPELSTLDRDTDVERLIDAARTGPLSVARVLHGIGDGR
jgi:hypothetical protein